MAQTRTDFIAGKMNKSVDERLVPPGQYIDALNVRLGSTEGTEIGAVENSKGNSKLTQLEYGGAPLVGEVRTIGCFEDGINETIYWFIHNENNPNSTITGVVDMVVSYNTNSNNLVYHVISTQLLNFNFEFLVTGVSKIEDLLFFTDDLNPPRMINVRRSPAYGLPVSGLDTVEEEDIGVIVKPPGYEYFNPLAGEISPLGTPHVELIDNGDTEETYMETRFLSFAYRYRYLDGQYSATSLFSTPAFQPNAFELSLQNYWNEGMENQFNACEVTFSTGSKRVLEVDLLYKESTSNVIYVIQRYNKSNLGWGDNNFQTVEFANSEIYSVLGSDELLRLYDNVPKLAKAQTIQGNRLVYGNIVDGYDITTTLGGSSIFIDYKTEPITLFLSGEDITTPTVTSSTYTYQDAVFPLPSGSNLSPHVEADSVITFDLGTAFPANTIISIGTTINFSLRIEQNTLMAGINEGINAPTIDNYNHTGLITTSTPVTQGGGDFFINPFTITFSFTASIEYPTVGDMLNSQEFKNIIGGSAAQGFQDPNIVQDLYPCYNSDNGGTLSDKFYSAFQAIQGVPTDPTLSGGNVGNGEFIFSGGIDLTCSSPSLLNLYSPSSTSSLPPLCGGGVLTAGTTDNGTIVVPGQMTDTTESFQGLISIGDIVTVTSSGSSFGLQASVLTVNSNTELSIQDFGSVSGGTLALQETGVEYSISTPGSTLAECPADGFGFSISGDTFSLQLPSTKSIQLVWTEGTLNQGAFQYLGLTRYYNFKAAQSEATFPDLDNSKSLHSNRDYEVGIVYMDDYGRASTVLVSGDNTSFFPPSSSININKIKVTLNNLPPYWAKKYKFVIKPSQGTYNTIYSSFYYKQDGTADPSASALPVLDLDQESHFWFKLQGQNTNILQIGDELTVKSDTQGPVVYDYKTIILDIQAFSSKGVTNVSLAGLYMLLKPSGWSMEDIATNYFYGLKENRNTDTASFSIFQSVNSQSSNGNALAAPSLEYNVNDASGVPYTIPAGSSVLIRIKVWRTGKKWCPKSLTYQRTFIASQDYANFHAFAVGENLQSKITTANPATTNVDGMDISFLPNLGSYDGGSASPIQPQTLFDIRCQVVEVPTGNQYFAVNASLPRCDQGIQSSSKDGILQVTIETTRSGGIVVFETKPEPVNEGIFYDASDLLDIEPIVTGGQGYHMASNKFDPSGSGSYSIVAGNQNQGFNSSGVQVPLIEILNFYNCWTFGNGVESYKIYDSPAGKPFNLGERTLAVSNQDFKEADRFAGLTYSGVYRASANVNNLNEFNLGLVNFKDCETAFGPIQLLHARRTDILTLQEDKITYVMADKNVISDAVGGGAIVATPLILGQQVARIEEYGISFNPESFVAWGSDMFFTDTKRGAVINLRGGAKGDTLQVISTFGLNSWFRDSFNIQLTTQKLGAYDPYMNEYVLGTNLRTVPVPVDILPCGQIVEQRNSFSEVSFDVNLGDVIGEINIPYTITSGSIDITVTWNGTVAASITGATSTGLPLTFIKTLNNPETCSIQVIPSETSNYTLEVECPIRTPLNVVMVVVNSNNYANEQTRINYNWNNGVTFSPSFSPSPSVTLTGSAQPSAYYDINQGIRSVGMFPYDGVNITLFSELFNTGINNFQFDPAYHKFKILSSSTLYNNTDTDINALLLASSEVSPAISLTTGNWQAVESNFSMPITNNYFYLVWDFRLISEQTVCYCDTSQVDVCCTCEVDCSTVYLGPNSETQFNACTLTVNSPSPLTTPQPITGIPIPPTYSYNGNGNLPTIGDVIFASRNCVGQFVTQGFYPVCSTPLAPAGIPTRWIQINSNGIVVATGVC